MSTTQTQVRSTEEALSVEDTLKLALEALENIVSAVDTPYRLLKPYHSEIDSVRKLIPVIKEALAQQCVCGEPNSVGTHRTDGPCLAPQPEHELTNLERHERNVKQLFGESQPKEPEQEPVADWDAWNMCSRLNSALSQIGDFAHDKSTGPAVPDALWEIRSMAYDAMESAPPQPQNEVRGNLSRKPLTDEQIWEAYMKAPVDIDCHVSDLHKFARAIEAALGVTASEAEDSQQRSKK